MRAFSGRGEWEGDSESLGPAGTAEKLFLLSILSTVVERDFLRRVTTPEIAINK